MASEKHCTPKPLYNQHPPDNNSGPVPEPAPPTSTHKTYQLRGYLTRAGYARLDQVMAECSVLYNAALQEWRDAWRMAGVSRTLYDQTRELTLVRQDDEFWRSIHLGVSRGVLRRLDRARQAFFRRVKAGEKPGYPRFRSRRRWKTIDLSQVTPGMVRDGLVVVKGLPPIRIQSRRELPSSKDLKCLRITREGRRVTVNLTYAVEVAALPPAHAAVGIDLGITSRLALSTGETMMAGEDIPAAVPGTAEIRSLEPPITTITPEGVAPREAESSYVDGAWGWQGLVAPRDAESSVDTATLSEANSLTNLQRRIARCRKGSRRWKERVRILANHRRRRRIANRNACHRITSELVRRFDHIGIEDLQIRNMTRSARGTIEEPGTNVAQKSGLNREILAQTWGVLGQQLEYKAAWYGRNLVKVDPRHTSQTCSGCGTVDGSSRRGKRYACSHCGLEMDADVNAAVNILKRSLADGNFPPPSQRDGRNGPDKGAQFPEEVE